MEHVWVLSLGEQALWSDPRLCGSIKKLLDLMDSMAL